MTDLIRSFPRSLEFEHAAAHRGMSFGVRVQLFAKRVIDIVLALAGLIVGFPMLVLVGVLVKLDSSGPALFRQTRVGRGGQRFRIAKFRTMVNGAEAVLAEDEELQRLHRSNNFKLASDQDPRVTRVGRLLRQTSLDELPQLWNVLLGDMSLVGPRPLPEDHFGAFGESQRRYVMMRPGITGYWQVAGRSTVGHEMPELTDHYVENWNLLLDLRIFAKTLPAVLTRHGAY